MASANYSGRSQYELILDVSVYDYSGGSVRFAYNLYARSKVGYGSFSNDAREFNVWIGPHHIAQGFAGLPFAPGDYAGKTIGLASGVTGYVPVGNYSFSGSHVNNGVIGSAYPSGSINVATVPPAPTPVATTPDQVTATTMRYQFSSNGDGGSGIIRWEYQWSTSPTFAAGNSAWMASNGTSIVTGLPQSTTIYLRSRGVNAIGDGGISATKSGTTLTSTAPGLAVAPALDGQSAVVGLTPPPEMPSPDNYKLEYRPVGGAATAVTVSSPVTISPLTPGVTYEWRAAAASGATVSPYTAWAPTSQPNPNTNPGDYFDGSSTPREDNTYAWTGVVNNSTSRAIASAPSGWGTFNSGNATSGGAGVLYRVTGGRSQEFAARVDFWSPTNVPGFHAGTGWVAGHGFSALQGAVYEGLIHVRIANRSQSLAAMFIWVDAANAEVGRDVGDPIIVPPSSTEWTALRATGTPPAGAVRGAIRVIDIAGPGWSAWAPGDSMLLDDAITPFSAYYFDGSTPDTVDTLYMWDGTPNASASRAVRSLLPPPNPLLDPDCPPVPAPPRPPMIDDSCVEEDVTEWRRFWQEIPATSVNSWIDSVPTLQIKTNTAARLVRVRYYPNPFGRPLSQLEADSNCSEQIISFIPADTIFTLDGVSQRAFAEVAGSSVSLAADSLLRGDSTLWPVIGCGIGYYITVDVPSDTPSNAISLSYSLVHRY